MNAGGKAFFTDTNVLLYAFGTAHPDKNAVAARWLAAIWASGSGSLSYQVLNEFYANAERKASMSIAEARRIVLTFAEWQPVDTSVGLIRRAWAAMDTAYLSYWDSLIVAAAEVAGCRWLVTEDLQHDQTFGTVTVVNPFRVPPEQFGLTVPE